MHPNLTGQPEIFKGKYVYEAHLEFSDNVLNNIILL